MACGCSCGHRTGCGSCCDAWSKLPGANSADFTLADATIALDKRYDGRYLQLVGGTLTGPLVLDGTAPVNPQDAADKSYVDGKLTSLLTLMPSVATQADLPATSDPKGSVRTVLADGTMWLFDGTSWQTIGKASTPIPRGTTRGDQLWWDGASWQVRVPVRELPNGTTANEILTWDGTAWVPQAPAQQVPNGVNDLDLLTWDVASQSWVTAADEFGDETNVTIASDGSSDQGVPIYSDGNNTWDVRKLSVDELAEVNGPNDGDVLRYDATNGWETEPLSLSDVSGVNLSGAVATGNALVFDGTAWVPRPMTSPTQFKGSLANAAALPAIAVLGDTYVTLDDGHLHVCTTASTTGTPAAVFDNIGPSSTPVTTLAGLTDVSIPSPAQGTVLTYDSGKWTAKANNSAFPIVVLTKAAYLALTPKDANTIYCVTP